MQGRTSVGEALGMELIYQLVYKLQLIITLPPSFYSLVNFFLKNGYTQINYRFYLLS